ncbi:calcium-binding protein [Luteolibacter flavescens]|uniref:Calcium-binding protein n=1 Tax=Luteolibacter flavescens TaxID=1859460 RepID=A0ABT3FRK6_9BACT|nr:calcium-binding protein [Luteolibacter flavescens]MCW1886212.1 calcium-binding protein [Luteolibacter flavescens]
MATQSEINALIAGLDGALAAIEADLIEQVFGDSLPLLGDGLSEAAAQGIPAAHHLLGVRDAIKGGLSTLQGSANYTRAQVEQAVANALSAASITAGAVTMDASDSADLKLSINTTRAFPAFALPLDGGLGMPGLGLQTQGSANTALNYSFALSIGVDAGGFYLNTANHASSLSVGITTTIPGFSASAKLSRIHFQIADESGTDGDSVPPTTFGGTFLVDLLDPSGADNRLRPGELGGDLLDATLSGNAAINLNFTSDLSSGALPKIIADLNYSWSFSASNVVAGDMNAGFGSRPVAAFRNVKLDLGSFFSDFAQPILAEVRSVTEPLQPIVEAMQEPIPLLTELNSMNQHVPKSLLEMAVASGAITQDQADDFDILAKIIDIANSIEPGAGSNVLIDLGDFDLGTVDPRLPDFDLAGITPNKIRNATLAVLQDPAVQSFVNKTGIFPKEILADGSLSKGLRFPILEEPETAFGLLLGKNVDLFTMDNATQQLPLYDIDEFIRLAGPLGFRFRGTGNIRLDIDFGFDTKGLFDLAESGDPLDVFNGFYILVPVDQNGAPISMAELNADMRASVAANVLLAEAGAGGSLFANAKATLTDTDENGKVHLDEFIANFDQSPLCVLQASGSLHYGLQAYVTVGVGPFSYTYDYDFPVGRIFDFSHACDDTPEPVLAHIAAGNAVLHIGPDAPLRVSGYIEDGPETFEITRRSGMAGNEQIGITFSGNGGTAGGPSAPPYGAVTSTIHGSGGEGNDTIRLAPDVLSPAHLEGNAGIDRLFGGAGQDTLSGGDGRDFLHGNGGNDSLLGGEGPDVLQGGPGADIHDGGPGIDMVSFADSTAAVTVNLTSGQHTGDAAGDTYLSIEQFEGSPFADTLTGDAGSNQFFGYGGDDILQGGDGDDALEGGPGADQLLGGNGRDFTSYFHSPQGVTVNLATGAATCGDAQGDFLSSIEDLVGSEFNDTLTGNAGDNSMAGLGGNDIIDAGNGTNLVQGGEGKDTITAGSGNDTLYGEGPDTPAFEGLQDQYNFDWSAYLPNQADTIHGGDGDNFIDGGIGDDHITSGAGNDRVLGGPGADTIQTGDGNDNVEGGTGRDIIDLGPGDDYVIVHLDIPGSPPYPEVPYPRFEGGRMVGTGGDTLQGGPGIDTVDLSRMMTRGYFSYYGYDTFGVIVNLSTGATNNGASETVILGFENVIGTDAADNLTGTEGPNVFQPLRGGGRISESFSGPDYIDGLGGIDTLKIDFSRADLPAAPRITTSSTTMIRPGFDSYMFASIERLEIIGASKDDQIHGPVQGHDDILIGMAGNDFLAGRGGSDRLEGGEGDDVLTGCGTIDLSSEFPADGHDILLGGPGNDLLDELAMHHGNYRGLAAGAVFEMDGGPGFDQFAIDLSNQTVPVVWSDATPTNLEFPNGTHVRNCEQVLRIFTGSGNDDITAGTRTNNWIVTGDGDDIVRPGFGTDRVFGGNGIDTLVVDFSMEDLPAYSGVYMTDTVYRRDNGSAGLDYIESYEFERFHITGASKNDQITGRAGNDILKGKGGNDSLNSREGADHLVGCETTGARGAAEIDQLTGGSGADTFVLGDATGRFYDDNVPGTPGHGGYARITDFEPASGDKLVLHGSGYLLGASPVAGVSGTALFHDSDGNGILDPGADELIATLGTATITPANTLGTATSPTAPDLAAAGLENFRTTAQPGGTFAISFSSFETLPANLVLEVEASHDLGASDPWRVIATKLPGSAWAGPVTTCAPSGGKVAATVTPPPLPAGQTKLFVRLRVRDP